MHAARIAALVLATVPMALAATAAPSAEVTQAVITGPAPVVRADGCAERESALTDRRAWLESERADTDRELEAIGIAGARLADELRALDTSNVAAVAAYNAHSAAHNARVDAYNRRIADGNSNAARVNTAAADLTTACGTPRYYVPLR